jgi:hypothetical protein
MNMHVDIFLRMHTVGQIPKCNQDIVVTIDKVCQLLAHGRWFSPVTPASSTTETGRHDIVEILLKVVLSTISQIKSNPFISKRGPLEFVVQSIIKISISLW